MNAGGELWAKHCCRCMNLLTSHPVAMPVISFRILFTGRIKEKTASQNHIDKFSGIMDDETANQMLEAVQECRRIEPDE